MNGRLAAAALAVAAQMAAQEAPALEYQGKPLAIPVACGEAMIEAFGMTCTPARPCPVYAELTGVESQGSRLFVVGNLHNGATTMYSLLIASEDGGRTWREPVERIPTAGLDQIRFLDLASGWISGHLLQPFPREPFFLITTDGGKSWRRRPVFSEPSTVGSIEEFRFESRTDGTMVMDRMEAGGESGRYEVYETKTGGDAWMIRQVSPRRPRLGPGPGPAGEAAWRIRTDAKLGANVVERRAGTEWREVAAFLVTAGECRPEARAEPELAEPMDDIQRF